MDDHRPEAAPDPHVLGPDQAPTPFTADEIRQGCPVGRTLRLLIEPTGAPPVHRLNRYARCDERGATIERSGVGADGEPDGPPEVDDVTWLDLQGHASFPVDQTTIESETIETPLGAEECQRYTVTDGATRQVFWFAVDRPGMPIRYLTEESGRVVMTVSVVADERA
ncbi:MAG TPA: hypothetical protein VEX15_02115 [Nocardioidaceae bacterium]|nr:hypothetical protein [Nocardioidaceae bacterium]